MANRTIRPVAAHTVPGSMPAAIGQGTISVVLVVLAYMQVNHWQV